MPGLRDIHKRRTIFDFYRKKADVICLQETHFEQNDEQIIRNEWSTDIVFSHGTTNSKGVCILFPRDKFYVLNNVKNDQDGRVVVCEINIAGNPIVIGNIYAPNQDDPHFFVNVFKMFENFLENKIIVGDYNLVMDTKMD